MFLNDNDDLKDAIQTNDWNKARSIIDEETNGFEGMYKRKGLHGLNLAVLIDSFKCETRQRKVASEITILDVDDPLNDDHTTTNPKKCPGGRTVLHYACLNFNTPLDIIQALLDEPFDAPLRHDEWGFTPVHYACRSSKTPSNVVQALLTDYADAPLLLDKLGLTPLHYAVRSSPQSTILAIVRACPEACSIISENSGTTPIHDAIIYDRSPFVIRTLLVQPSAIMLGRYHDRTPIQTFFDHWFVGLRKAIRLYSNYYSNNKQQKAQQSFSEIILTRPLSTSYKKRNVESKSKGRKVEDVCNTTLLLLQAKVLGKINIFSDVMNFYAAKESLVNYSCPWPFFNLIIRIHPNLIYHHDDDGNYLLHIAVSVKSLGDDYMHSCSRCHAQISTAWFGPHFGVTCQRCLSVLDDSERDQYSLFCDKIPAAILDLVKINRRSAYIPNGQGRLPLHLSVENSKDFDEGCVRMIYEAGPLALITRDVTCHLYPFMLAAAALRRRHDNNKNEDKDRRLECMTLSYNLLIENPDLIIGKVLRSPLLKKTPSSFDVAPVKPKPLQMPPTVLPQASFRSIRKYLLKLF